MASNISIEPPVPDIGRLADKVLRRIEHPRDDRWTSFERDKRGMRPTSFAEGLRAYAQAACTGYDQVLAELHASTNGLKNTVTIAGAPVLSSKLFPEAIVRTTRQNPHFHIKAMAQDILR